MSIASAAAATPADATPSEPAWLVDDVCAAFRVSRSYLEHLRATGRFPQPDFIIGRRPRWMASTVRVWVEAQKADARSANVA